MSRYSIINFSGILLPSVWDCESDTEEGALQEALAMHSSRLSTFPAFSLIGRRVATDRS